MPGSTGFVGPDVAAGPGPRTGRAAAVPMPVVRLDRTVPPTGPEPQLDAEQRGVVEHHAGNLLVLAGPGTGKTTAIARLLVLLLFVPATVFLYLRDLPLP